MKPSERLGGVLAIVVALLVVAGCGYGEVSPKAYQFAKTLYGLCNRQTSEAIDPVAVQIGAAREAEEITQREADWLDAILNDARAGDWSAAQAAARRMMEDQVGR
ncbi:hypothetical protein Pla108_12350 [Botrimarina colliarenosi]|uniref:Lipoprotein n=1 Tax=Botrimarina colliarenosi TaxID=2528001 RepID=A0A5C6AMD9_9BACT|nr:hypothetical protein [Botrimarina colliarenosi]TWU00286.1 hypothetical protein Pla108_12350 [Botrimarina colliarenosi]